MIIPADESPMIERKLHALCDFVSIKTILILDLNTPQTRVNFVAN